MAFLTKPGQPEPYQALVWRDGKKLTLGNLATAEEEAGGEEVVPGGESKKTISGGGSMGGDMASEPPSKVAMAVWNMLC